MLSRKVPTSNGKQSEHNQPPRVLPPFPVLVVFVLRAVYTCVGLIFLSISRSVIRIPSTRHTMKRNFGSLNLAALDLSRSSSTSADAANCSLEDRFSTMGPGVEDCSMDAAGPEYSSDENVGFPLERFQLPATDVHAGPHSLRSEAPQNTTMKDGSSDLSLPIRTPSVIPSHSEDSDVRKSELLHLSSSETPQLLHDQQQVELNALRCLSLKVMLSNLSTSSNNHTSTSASAGVSVASNKSNYTYPGVNNRAKTALLPLRHPSLQSV